MLVSFILLLIGCVNSLPLKREPTKPTYKGYGKIEVTTKEGGFVGDFLFIGDEAQFIVEAYFLGMLVFKIEEKHGEVIYYYEGNNWNENFLSSFIPMKFEIFKTILIDVSEGKEVDMKERSYVVHSQLKEGANILHILLPDKGEIKITLEKEE